jgi:hypothetical protein
MATRATLDSIRPPLTCSISLSASATTDGMEAAIQVKDRQGNNVAGVFPLEVYYSESSAGIGLTADAYSGTLTAVSNKGAILTALTAKKHVSAVTNASGLLTLLVVDSANPADQYVCVKRPYGAGVIVSAASGTNWEGV